ncbi:MAG: glycosyltransferase, partial [Clostridia bacterium]
MNKPIRVLQNIQTISLGGVETFIMNYYRNIDRTKVQFDFIVRMYDNMPNDFEKEILTLGGKIYNVPTFKHGKLFLFEIMKIIKKNGYKIIHSHSNIYSVYSLFSAKCAKVPVRIAHCHNTSADKGVLYPFKMILKPFVRKLSTDRLACSLKAGKWLFGEKTFKIIPNAIDTKKYEFNNEVRLLKRKEIGLSDDFTIINIGRFTEQKNQLFLLDIFNEIVKNDSNAK